MANNAGKGGKGPVVGYGDKGKAFHNQKNYNQSKSGQAHAKNPNLSKAPLAYGKKGNAFFSKGQVASHPAAQPNKKSPQQAMGVTHSKGPAQMHGPHTTGAVKLTSVSGQMPRGVSR